MIISIFALIISISILVCNKVISTTLQDRNSFLGEQNLSVWEYRIGWYLAGLLFLTLSGYDIFLRLNGQK